MVQKLQREAYLGRYDDMTAEEKAAYSGRVGEWMRSEGKLLEEKLHAFNARLQNIQAISLAWNDAECQAFEEGTVLLSALVGLTDTWLPDMLYVKSAKRAIDIMRTAFETVLTSAEIPDGQGVNDGVRMQAGEAKEAGYTVKANGAASAAAGNGPTDVTQAKPEDVQDGVSVTPPVPARPKHVDQYVHLLPEKTQEHAAQLKDLYRELDETRRKMDLLMEDKTAKDSDREAWAKKATSTDNKIRKILDELDAEWAKLVKQGRVMVDDLGNAHVCECPAEDAASEPEKQELTSGQKTRRRELRKWLVDTRRGNGDTREEHTRKWQENFREFLTLEGDTAYDDEKVKAAAVHYGIDLAGMKKTD